MTTLDLSFPRSASAALGAASRLLARIGATLLVFAFFFTVFWMAVAVVTYRLPAFQERQVIQGRLIWNKVEMGNRGMFENVFAGREIVRLDGKAELYLPMADIDRLFAGKGTDSASISASPLLFGGYADARLIRVVRPGGTPAPAD